jgi:Domain of unknown function (DUF4149)
VKLASNAFRILFVLWAGSLWSVAAWVAPTLFYAQSDRHLAGVLAGRLFSIETYVAIAVALFALLSGNRGRFKWAYVAALLLAVNEWLVQPLMRTARANGSVAGLGFGAWHGVGALVYLAACVLVLLLVWNDDFR